MGLAVSPASRAPDLSRHVPLQIQTGRADGHTDKDSHLDLPVVKKTMAQLEAVELAPFAHACRAGIDVFLFCHDLSRAVEAWEFLSTEAEKDAAMRAQVENSFRRITALKERCVKGSPACRRTTSNRGYGS
ncbi:MAG TPA: hypothetical protein VNN13_08195 [Methylomirabilota bacterium]|nr:hypothetical protein [Methylomirabilota bacterium]